MAGGEATKPPEGPVLGSRTAGLNDAASTGELRQLIPSLVELNETHTALMRAYLRAVNLASFLPLLFITRRWWNRNRIPAYGDTPHLGKHLDEGSLVKPQWLAVGFAARLYVEAHIRGKLRELRAAYTQLQQALDVGADENYRRWLNDARESMADFSASLGHFHRLRIGIGALWPAATALVTALGFELSPREWIDTTVALIVAIVVIVDLGPYLYLLSRSSFLVKRDLFFPGARFIEKQSPEIQRAAGGHVYVAEREVFELLNRAKRRESAVDIIGASVVLAVAIAVAILGVAQLLDLGEDPIVLLGTIGFFGVVVFYVWRISRRVWR